LQLKTIIKIKMTGECNLCRQEKELRYSHILPEFMYQNLYDHAPKRFYALTVNLDKAEGSKRRIEQKGIREYLLCGECEVLLSNINADAKEFTTILTLKEENKILYSPLFKFQEVRPGDDVINGLFNVTLNFWTDAIANIPKYSEVLRPENPTVSVNVYRNRNGGSILFRPVGLKILAEVYVNWKNFHGETTGFWEVFNRIDDDLNGEYWKDVVWDNAKKKINKTSEKFLREYTNYLIGLPFDEEFTVLEYSKMKGVEDVTVQTIELPTQP